MNKIKDQFLWGVVNIGAQTEGNDYSNNWSAWARRDLVPQIGVANAYERRYREDHDLVEELGCNSMRMTIEWSRIEPKENVFDDEMLNYYESVLHDLKKRNIRTVVGLWHWSIPLWCEELYGMHDRRVVKKFERFAQHICTHLGQMIDHVVVINEPTVYVRSSYIAGSRPPFVKSYMKACCVSKNLIAMHKNVYRLWKKTYPHTSIGSAFLWNDECGAQSTIMQKIYFAIKKYFSVTFFIRALHSCSDFIGINYYTSDRFFFGKREKIWGIHGTNDWHDPDVWRKFPEGLYTVLMQVKKYHKPIIILENGKPTDSGTQDLDRQTFLEQSVMYVKKAKIDGADVRGYFHYCLCDSYEWDSGYNFKFGLVEIDRATGERVRRDSFETYKVIIAQNRE